MNEWSFLDSFSRGFSRALLKYASSFVNDADFPSLSPFSSSFNIGKCSKADAYPSKNNGQRNYSLQKKTKLAGTIACLSLSH
jgi:hypothetical protein